MKHPHLLKGLVGAIASAVQGAAMGLVGLRVAMELVDLGVAMVADLTAVMEVDQKEAMAVDLKEAMVAVMEAVDLVADMEAVVALLPIGWAALVDGTHSKDVTILSNIMEAALEVLVIHLDMLLEVMAEAVPVMEVPEGTLEVLEATEADLVMVVDLATEADLVTGVEQVMTPTLTLVTNLATQERLQGGIPVAAMAQYLQKFPQEGGELTNGNEMDTDLVPSAYGPGHLQMVTDQVALITGQVPLITGQVALITGQVVPTNLAQMKVTGRTRFLALANLGKDLGQVDTGLGMRNGNKAHQGQVATDLLGLVTGTGLSTGHPVVHAAATLLAQTMVGRATGRLKTATTDRPTHLETTGMEASGPATTGTTTGQLTDLETTAIAQ